LAEWLVAPGIRPTGWRERRDLYRLMLKGEAPA
jgi:hypothetical protein